MTGYTRVPAINVGGEIMIGWGPDTGQIIKEKVAKLKKEDE